VLEAELMSPCLGEGYEHRLILMMRCPGCAATGQLRLTKAAHGEKAPRVPAVPNATVSFTGGGSGYVGLSCSCGGAGSFHYLGHVVLATGLLVHGVVPGCGHALAVTLPRSGHFTFAPHRG
jgi:hypothetical protein